MECASEKESLTFDGTDTSEGTSSLTPSCVSASTSFSLGDDLVAEDDHHQVFAVDDILVAVQDVPPSKWKSSWTAKLAFASPRCKGEAAIVGALSNLISARSGQEHENLVAALGNLEDAAVKACEEARNDVFLLSTMKQREQESQARIARLEAMLALKEQSLKESEAVSLNVAKELKQQHKEKVNDIFLRMNEKDFARKQQKEARMKNTSKSWMFASCFPEPEECDHTLTFSSPSLNWSAEH